MSAFTDDDVTAGMEAIGDKTQQGESDVRDVLAAVAPAIAARAEVRGVEKALARVDRYQADHDREIAARALREAAEEWGEMRRGNNTPDGEAWLRARADRVDGDQETDVR